MFPQVIPRFNDQSQIPQNNSRFRAGLVGIAQKGPFNEVTAVPSIYEFVRKFGNPLPGSYLGDAVALIAANSDGCKVVRVGAQYEPMVVGNASGNAGEYAVRTPNANLFVPGDYVRIRQPAMHTTTNAVVESVDDTLITFVSVGDQAMALSDDYHGASIDKASVANAATPAEGFVSAPTYDADMDGTLGTVIGDKNAYSFVVSLDQTQLVPGDTIKIAQAGKITTSEVRVKSVRGDKTVFLVNSNDTESGYQALSLQDSYTAASVSKVLDQVGVEACLLIQAASDGTWANTQGSTSGVTVRVGPGSVAGSKQLQVYSGSTLVETIDSLVMDPTDPNYYTNRVNGKSAYINILGVLGTEPPGNTRIPWNTATYPTTNVVELSGGFDGEDVSVADYVGEIDPSNDQPSGLKLFDDPNDSSVAVDFLCVPDSSDPAVFQEITRIGMHINAEGIGHAPDGLNLREATDWHNGVGLYADNGRIDNARLAIFWNWFKMANTFTGEIKWVPPSLAYLAAAANTANIAYPWTAVAGDIYGVATEALDIRYRRSSMDALNASYGNGNSVNVLILMGNSIEIYGDRTMQRTESKTTALHTMVLVNYILKGFASIARRYTFQPIDQVLFSQLSLEYNDFMEAVKRERGVEGYSIQVDSKNNTPATINARRVIVDLSFIPEDVAEVFIITASVEKSGTTLLNISSTPTNSS
jgi:hypothetical protein